MTPDEILSGAPHPKMRVTDGPDGTRRMYKMHPVPGCVGAYVEGRRIRDSKRAFPRGTEWHVAPRPGDPLGPLGLLAEWHTPARRGRVWLPLWVWARPEKCASEAWFRALPGEVNALEGASQ